MLPQQFYASMVKWSAQKKEKKKRKEKGKKKKKVHTMNQYKPIQTLAALF